MAEAAREFSEEGVMTAQGVLLLAFIGIGLAGGILALLLTRADFDALRGRRGR